MIVCPRALDFRARELLLPLVNGTGMVREWSLSVVDETRFVLTPTQQGLDAALDQADRAPAVDDRYDKGVGLALEASEHLASRRLGRNRLGALGQDFDGRHIRP